MRRQHEIEFKERSKNWNVLDSINHSSGIKKGDLVIVKNGYGFEIGPFKVLGFCIKNNIPKMYLDWDCWWYSINLDRIVKILN